MKTGKKPALLAAFCGGALLLLQASSLTQPVRVAEVPAAAPAADAIRAARFAEPLVVTAATTPEEDLALSYALAAYERRARPDDLSSLAAFLSEHPHSGWAAALQTNLGLSYLHDGYFSRALDAWQKALREGKGATEPRARALVDRAIGELARLYTSLGQFERVAALFDEIGDRPVTGSATEAVQVAQETRLLAKKDPRHLFLCGPMALRNLLVTKGRVAEELRFLDRYRAGPDGTTLAEVARLADSAKFSHRLVFRRPGDPVPVPSIVHWRLGHFAAIVGEANGRFRLQDPVFPGQELWVTPDALDAEASGYFLVPADTANKAAWRTVAAKEAAGVWGKGPTNGTRSGDPGDPPADGGDPTNPMDAAANGDNPPPPNCPSSCPSCGGMCGYGIKEASVSVTLSDTLVGYTPPIGPSAQVRVTYNQREDSQPANFSFFNVSPKWTLNWLAYVIDDPTNAGATVSRYMGGGGAFSYTGYNSTTHLFAAQDNDGSTLALASQSPITYKRVLRDGSTEVYAQSNGATSYPRYVFMTQKIDPQGNVLTLNYDNQQRLVSLTDATGRQTTFTYGQPGLSLLVTQITDPFGRSATLAYDLSGRLSSITDVIGLTSSFAYDSNSLVNSMTTPYGTTSFAYTAPGTSSPPRFVQVTDPLGYNEREEWLEPASIADSDPSATVPVGMPVPLTNQYLSYRNSFHWDKNAYVVAGCTPSGGCDYTKARIRQFNHVPPNTSLKSTSIGSVKYPLENRIWYVYPGQTSSVYGGSFDKPIAVGRVLDDGTTQLTQYAYDPVTFNLMQITDPLGRSTRFAYSNGVDLAAISQSTAYGVQTAIAQFTYNTQHRPLIYTDAALKTTYFTYNAAGQLASLTNPLNQATTYQYDSANNLTTIINANSQTAASFTYDSFARVRTYTDSEGWAVTYDYDAADRVTKITYPDGTADIYTYNNLDLASYQDRQGRVWTYTHDANRRLVAINDPLGQQTVFAYNRIGLLTSLADPRSNTTSWTYDVQGRLTAKQYADTSSVAYAYETTTSRLKSITDALGQIKQFGYAKDNRLAGISYSSAVHTTPNVTFTDDPFFPRLVSMADGNGTTQYSYVAIGTAGALRLAQESGPLTNGTINYAYDALGRLSSRTVYGAGAETFAYDAIGRLTTHASDLGSFALSYLGQTGQIAQRQLASSNLVTAWSYLPNSGDRRLSGINNTGLATSQLSNYTFTTTPEKFIAAIGETSDSTIVYPGTLTQTASYNNLNQLTLLSGQSLTFDANGNLTADGLRNYTWDAENRLVGITYPGQTGKATAFTYDGLSRRTAIASTPTGGGSTVTTKYLWCGTRICQARNSSNAVTRKYYDEGEVVPGSPAQPYYYGVDQLGSVRRAFASTSSAPAFSYDPYGKPLQGTAPLTDFNYAGMFFNSDSGLYLTQYRAYDPVPGRWLSRDPLGEVGDIADSTSSTVLFNALRSTRKLTDIFSGVPTSSAYDLYGESLQTTAPLTSFIYANKFYSANTGFYLTQQHGYDPIAVRWVSSNPNGEMANVTANLYWYVYGNPVSLTDSTGEGSVGNFIRACGIVIGLTFGGGEAIGTSKPPYQPPPVVQIQPPGPRPKPD